VQSGLLKLTILDLLALEDMFPELSRDIDTCVWQVELVKAQMKAQSNG
jgi:hypothetical protein